MKSVFVSEAIDDLSFYPDSNNLRTEISLY